MLAHETCHPFLTSDAPPQDSSFRRRKALPDVLPAVDHYAGSEKLMRKALELQKELGPIFDITCDCEDGARRRRARACRNGGRASS
jgi:hypothetical protein